jgi:prepilin-type N-terminal cleavage/methylation domain-containing protein
MKKATTANSKGFTLLELVMVLSIMGVVSTIGVGGFFRMTTHWNDLMLTMAQHRSGSSVFAVMKEDFDNMLSGRVCGIGLRGRQADVEDDLRLWRVSFEDDRLNFPVELMNPLTQTKERLIVSYAMDRTTQPCLVRTTTPLGDISKEGTKTVVGQGVCGMRINYFDGTNWRHQWASLEPPQLVRISLSLMDYDRVDKQLSRVVTFPIMVK